MRWTIALVLMVLAFGSATAQKDSMGQPVLKVCKNMTTTLVFAKMVTNVDRGSPDILVQRLKEAGNIVQLKAAVDSFRETSLSVITADGSVHAFVVRYASGSVQLTVPVDSSKSTFEKIADREVWIRGVKNSHYEMVFRLTGLYIVDNILYCKLALKNESNISYDIDMLRYYTKDKRQSRRVATQELDQEAIGVYGNEGVVAGQSTMNMVVALPKFTISDKKHFFIEVMERNGGRHLKLKVSNRKLLQAKVLKTNIEF